ncbi:permease-like cell division protein FtsX [Catenovulum sp. 2E275]|uniref:permease-like cell division protein FtsX n=1 Tax=Catenovulum sp. 2E275 TaxID=2980497 RepID=UPI0021CE86B3|nr:permease-like cell division protein FtsX [Catenovulum sp. 2E275]MCU4676599.1 permease-like cell division protein FtsX [Catenovulum sp. 2E275]
MSLLFKNRERSSGANQRKLSFIQKIRSFFISHLRQWLSSLGSIWRDPMPSILTIAVLGVSLTLPATLYVVVKNAESVEQNWQSAAEISLFLQDELNQQQLSTFIKQVELNHKVDKVRLISKDDALAEFEQESGFGDALNLLDSNPLPNVLVVAPLPEFSSASAAKDLLTELEQMREVDFGKLDIEWLRRLNALLSMVNTALSSLVILLCISVVLIVGNTIRLSIANRKEEIEVLKLVGATDSFIQRPFLYTGLWYGFFAGMLAWFSIEILLLFLASSIEKLTELYHSNFSLAGLSIGEMFILLGISMLLGWLGSFIVVRQQIKQIEPELG